MLTAWERWCLGEVAPLVAGRVIRWAAAALLVLLCVHWLLRLFGAPAAAAGAGPTLYDPARLGAALRMFAAGGGGAGGPPARHQTEALCRELLERMLGLELPKCRPRFLVNPVTRRALELDMYNADARLAFEYDGAQHDVYTPHYHVSEDHFRYRQLLDRLKTDLCRDAGVTLIRIPWRAVSASDPTRTARYLRSLLRAHRIPHRPSE